MKQSTVAVWRFYHKLVNDLVKAKFALCSDTKMRFILYHQIIRMQLLVVLIEKLLTKYNIETLTSLSIKIGLSETKLSSILNHPEYAIDRESEIKIFRYLYN